MGCSSRDGLNPREWSKRCRESRGSRPELGSAGVGCERAGLEGPSRCRCRRFHPAQSRCAARERPRSAGSRRLPQPRHWGWTYPDTETDTDTDTDTDPDTGTGTGTGTSRSPSRPSPLRPARRRLRQIGRAHV